MILFGVPTDSSIEVVTIIPVNRPVELEEVNKLWFKATPVCFEPPLGSKGVWLADVIERLLQESVVVERKYDVAGAKPLSKISVQLRGVAGRCLNEYPLDRFPRSDY